MCSVARSIVIVISGKRGLPWSVPLLAPAQGCFLFCPACGYCYPGLSFLTTDAL